MLFFVYRIYYGIFVRVVFFLVLGFCNYVVSFVEICGIDSEFVVRVSFECGICLLIGVCEVGLGIRIVM